MWSEEDRLTYALQAEGPDMFPESYYRRLARIDIAARNRLRMPRIWEGDYA
jgi:hypothetical protein